MSAARTLLLATVLAVAAVAGIIGMLLADGAWDALYFALATSPLALGAVAGWRFRWGRAPLARPASAASSRHRSSGPA